MDECHINIDEKIILMVQNHKFLYDKREPFSKNNDVKENAWTSIAKELNTSTDFVKKRWDSLRDRFVRAYREFTCPIPSEYVDPNKSKKYKDFPYYQMMDWLMPYIRKRKSVCIPSSSFVSSFSVEEENFTDFSNTEDGQEFDLKIDAIEEEQLEPQSPKRRKIDSEQISQLNFPIISDDLKINKNTTHNYVISRTADEYFMQSIALDMAMLPNNLKLEFKLEVMKLLQTYLKKNSS